MLIFTTTIAIRFAKYRLIICFWHSIFISMKVERYLEKKIISNFRKSNPDKILCINCKYFKRKKDESYWEITEKDAMNCPCYHCTNPSLKYRKPSVDCIKFALNFSCNRFKK